jgi:outer membrane protein TolC
LAGLFAVVVCGCRAHSKFAFDSKGRAAAWIDTVGLDSEHRHVEVAGATDAWALQAPRTLRNAAPGEPWPLSLEQAVQIALTNSEVLRRLGAHILETPAAVRSVFDPAIQETDPLLGTEAALSAFDAQFGTNLFLGHNERTLNNLASRGVRNWRQGTGTMEAEINKTAATGTSFSLRNVTLSDSNNAPTNLFPSSWETYFEAGFRQPLLQGAGVAFNRIAGPHSRPGIYNGVLIARLRTDVELADFEIAVRTLLRDTEQAYWRLYFAYRDVDARRASYEEALATWRLVRDRLTTGDVDGEQESLARERVFAAQAELENALNGPPDRYPDELVGFSESTLDDGGLYGYERQLRYLLGLPGNDGRLIRTADEPLRAEFVFDWHESLAEAFFRRPELRKQKLGIKRREFELAAARNFGLMRADLVGDYRLRGFGDDLVGQQGVPNGSAFGNLGDLQEWRVGIELKTPVGNRLGHAAIRNAELQLAREEAVYRQQELRIAHELSAAFAQLDRAQQLSRTYYNRRIAAHERLAALRAKFANRVQEDGDALLEFLLNAQRRTVLADRDYYRSLVDYNLAIANLHLARGSFLASLNVHLAEGPWGQEGHCLAVSRDRGLQPNSLDYSSASPPVEEIYPRNPDESR